MEPLPLYIPVILGTTRMGRMSAHVARLLTEEVSKQAGVETDFIDIACLPLPTNDAGEAIKEGAFSSKMDRGDGLVIVAPEYNHGYNGLLKHVLDSCLKEYIHKPSACHARTWIGHDLLGRELFYCAGVVRRQRKAARTRVRSAH